MTSILKVVVSSPLHYAFDYLLPVDFPQVQPGQRVKVPFGKQKTTVGLVVDVVNQSELSSEKLKPILELIDMSPLVSAEIIKLFQLASEYYHYPMGEIALGTMPKWLRSGRVLELEKNTLAPFLLETAPVTLNKEQKEAVDAITATNGFQVFLLNGVTGSGKTEVYLQSMLPLLEAGKQALVLVPEISLTPQTVERFSKRFNVPVAVMHSELADGQRAKAYVSAAQGNAKIIIGTRSAVFTPLKNTGIIIVDEEHDSSFKQHTGFRYSARDLAVLRAQIENVPIVLGSATPSIKSLYNTINKKYVSLMLPDRAGNARKPTTHLIDLRDQVLQNGFSSSLISAICRHLSAGNQVLIFLNRRGYAPVLMCHHCGHVVHCEHCDARMTLHFYPKRMACHHCGVEKTLLRACGNCRQSELLPIGLGTENIEQQMQSLFPQYQTLRVDRDSISGKKALEAALKKINDNEAQILIGTQMLAKGHHFPNVTMVAVVEADNGLFSVDFRAMEHLAQLLVQVSGRAGRAEKPGEVYIQTHQPDHPLLQLLLSEGYLAFSNQVLEERRAANLPPYSHFALLRAEAKDRQNAMDFLNDAKQFVERCNASGLHCMGPISALMERKADRYRAILLMQSNARPILQQTLKPLASAIKQFRFERKVRWVLDVDPLEII